MDALVYDNWLEYYDPNDIEKSEIDEFLSSYFQIEKKNVWANKRVLEIGCGTGRFSAKIIKDIDLLYAIDPDDSRLRVFNNKFNKDYNHKIKTFESTLNKLRVKSCLWDKFDIIVFSWSWAYIDDAEKAKTLDIAMNLLKDNGVIIFTMVVGGEFEKICDKLLKSNDLNRNKLAMNALLKLSNYDKPNNCLIYNKEFETFFDFPSKEVAIEQIKNDIGKNVDDNDILNEIGNKSRLTDLIQLVILKKAPHKKITFNYKLCDNQGDCSAMVACREYSVGAIVHKSDDSNEENKQLRVLEHLCVECKRCISICELFSLHNTWAEFFETNRHIEALERKVHYMDEFRYGSGSGDNTRRLKSYEDLLDKIKSTKGPFIFEIVDGRNHASSYDCPKIVDLIGLERFDQIYYKYDIPATIEQERFSKICKELKELLNITVFPTLVIVYDRKVCYKFEGHMSITIHGNETIKHVHDEINNVLGGKEYE